MKKGELLNRVLVLSVNSHAGQFDRGNNPYILHSLKVMHYLKTNDEELQCIALLHDVVEDTKTTWQDLIDIGCTDRIISALKCLTKIPGQSNEEYQEVVMSNIDAMRVKLCDLRHNSDIRRLKGITEKDIKRLQKYNEFYLKINERLAYLGVS